MTSSAATYIHLLLQDASDQSASDIHFYPHEKKEKVNIFFRIHGMRKFIRTIRLNVYETLVTYLKFTAGLDIGEKRLPQSGTLPFTTKDHRHFSLRISTLPLTTVESMTIRLLEQTNLLSLDELFLFRFQYEQIKTLTKKTTGLIIFSGPTGSGKTTTMYALLEAMKQRSQLQAITLEDPIEKQISDVIQVEINERAGITYATGLKAVLRHDPDVILLGEIRDEMTAQYAVRAALTGHLVISTLHAKDAYGTIDRLRDLGIQPIDLQQTLIAIVAMQLLPFQRKGKITRRAAIVEILDEQKIQSSFMERQRMESPHDTFEQLRVKAYAYGFITKETFAQFHH